MSRDPLEWYRRRLEGLRKGSTPQEWVDDYERLLRVAELAQVIVDKPFIGPSAVEAILNERPGDDT